MADSWRPALPLDSMDYLDGYLSMIYDSDLPDGAWFEAQVALIEEHWNDVENLDAHECFMQYLQWKNPQKEEGNGNEESSEEEGTGKEEGDTQEGEQEEGE